MTSMCGKRHKYLRNGFTMLEMTQNLTNGSTMWELTQRFWEMAKLFGKWLRYTGHGLSISGTA